MTYATLDARSEALAGGLLAAGLHRGDRVAVLAGNRPETVVVLFACAKAGLMLLPLNPRLAPPELAFQLEDADPALLLVAPELDVLAEKGLGAAGVSPRLAPLTSEGLDGLAGCDALEAPVGDDDPLLLMYTSGTTGRPKGALLTHANCFWTNLSLDRTIDVGG